ncbi:MAG: isoleucine--tRNA ligase [Rubricoccaceae bacterium]|nr:isoleucine--tRNA ligase [Rubricoccaceae bacterium]
MPRFPEVDSFDHAAVEEEVLARWEAEDTFQKSLDRREGAPHFVFYEGPPTANGKPGIHHVMARTIKDLFCRYQTMKGFRVDRKAGWDTHGLPVEIEVEKALGLEGRHQVEDYGIAAYNAACRESVLRYKDLWDTLTVRMGYWVDLGDPYVTFRNAYIESVWALLKAISEKRTADGEPFLYRGYKIQWYSPANETVLSSHEVSLGYKEVQDPSIYVKSRVEGEDDTFFLAWTTTPWTVPSNAALAVGPRIEYVKVRVPTEDGGHEHLILAEARLGVLDGEVEVVERMKGSDLVGRRYEPMFAHFAERLGEDAAWRVVPADYVTTEDGTGVVHTAPAFGADDFATGQAEGLPLLNPILPDGRFEPDFPLVGGLWFKDADKPLAQDLRARGLLYRWDTYLHNYPHDWRKGTPLLSYPVESWFIRTTAVKDRMVELNASINWQPEGIGQGRFGQWLENNVDWAISRMRYWGTPLPIWVSDQNPEHVEVIGSLDELRVRCGGAFPDAALNPETGEVDLHRPYVDAITWPDGRGGTMRRVPDLLDVWFDSGAMPFAQWHHPFENEARFRDNFPADFIAEGVDQTRGWFYTLHAIAALVMDSVAYKNVVVNGLVLDADGQKMSKSLGNAVDPFAAIQAHGADPVRWSMMATSPPWENLRYADAAVLDTRRRVFGTLVNTYRFFATYANLDGFEPGRGEGARSELDRWIRSRLQTTVQEVDEAYAAYHPTRAARAVETFVDDLSNWYLRRSRRRFWKAESEADQQAAYATLHACLQTTAQLMAPIAPFFADWLWRSLGGEAGARPSVHLTDFPEADASEQDAALERRMALARQIATNVLALRNEAGLNVRQPLPRALVVTGVGGVEADDVRAVASIVRDEVNVKALEILGPESELIHKSAKPNFKVLGKRLGPLMKAANAAIRDLDAEAITRYEADERLTLQLNGEAVELGPGDLEIASEGIEGWLVRQEGGVTVALDTALDDALRAEGLAREFINRVQTLRKSAAFDVADRIVVTFKAPDAVAAAVEAHASTIMTETLALTLERAAAGGPTGEAVQTVDLAGTPVTIGVRRA